MIDPTAILAELAAIQRDVRAIHAAIILRSFGHSAIAADTLALSVVERIGLLMSSIAAPSPVEVDPAEAAERTKHWPACGRRKRTDARCVCDRDHDTYRASGHVEPIRPPAIPITSPGTYAAADNGMLAPIRARLDRMEREIAKLDERIERDRFDLDRRVMKLEARIDGGDPGDEQETRHG